MEIGVLDAAERLGVSPQRVRQLLESGQLSGRKVGGIWVLDESELRRTPPISRPLSGRMAWGLIDLLAGPSNERSEGLTAHERYRLREMINRLRIASNPVPLLRSWLPKRADRIQLSCPEGDLRDLELDARIVRSGISDPRSGMSAGSELECYVLMPDLPALKAEYLLVPSARPNVYLHVSPRHLLMVPLILVAADLADHNGARENSQAEKLLKETLWS